MLPLRSYRERRAVQGVSITAKHLIDTIKMIAYRPKQPGSGAQRKDVGVTMTPAVPPRYLPHRKLICSPDNEKGTLTVRLHHLANCRR